LPRERKKKRGRTIFGLKKKAANVSRHHKGKLKFQATNARSKTLWNILGLFKKYSLEGRKGGTMGEKGEGGEEKGSQGI